MPNKLSAIRVGFFAIVLPFVVLGQSHPAPVAHWKFEGDSRDATGRHDLVGMGEMPSYDAGNSSGTKAVRFPGNEKIYLATSGDDATFDFGAREFTLELSVKFDKLDGEQVLLDKLQPDLKGWTLTKLGDNRLRFDSAETGITKGEYLPPGGACANLYTLENAVLTAGQWHHILVTRVKSKCSAGGLDTLLYLDSKLIGVRVGGNGPVQESTAPLVVGQRRGGSNGCFFVGLIDEVIVWDNARLP